MVRAVMRAAARRASLNRHPDAAYTAATVLTGTNRAMQRELAETEALVTVFAAYIDGPSGTVNYADAGHGLTVVVSHDGSARWLESLDLPLGVDPDAIWAEFQTVLQPGETLLCFSDGLLDLLGDRREITGLVRLHPDPQGLTEHLRELTTSAAPTDDVTALAVRRQTGR